MFSKRYSAFALFLAAGAAIAADGPVPATEMSVEQFFRPSEFSQLSLSPDGSTIAALHTGESYASNLLLIDADKMIEEQTLDARALTGFEVGGIGSYVWKSDDRLLFRGRSDIRAEGAAAGSFVAAYSIDVEGKKARKFLDRRCQETGNRGQSCYPINDQYDIVFFDESRILDMMPGEDFITIASPPSPGSQYPDVLRLDIESGRIRPLVNNEWDLLQWFRNSSQELTAAVQHERGTVNNYLVVRDDEEAEWRRVLGPFEATDVEVLGYDGDDRHLIVLSRLNRDRSAAFRLDTRTGELGDPIAEDPIYDIEQVRWAGRPGEPTHAVYAATRGDKPRYYYFDRPVASAIRDVQATVDHYFPDTVNTLQDWDKSLNRFLVRAWSDKVAARYYLLDMEAGKLRFLVDARPWQDPSTMAEMRPITYETRDGLTIHGYLTIPHGWDGEPMPLILNPHGGPHGPRDAWGWSKEGQFFASKGWMTLQVNYRGSGGYGRTFQESGYRKWGLEMQDDLTDAVAWAIEEGYADPDSVCIYGASYGGYATLQGLVKTPDLYACGVSYVGVSDLPKLLDYDTRTTTYGYRDTFMSTIMQRYLGDVGDQADKQRLYETSPLNHVERIQAPLLVIHGEADARVDIDTQFYPLVRRLGNEGKEFEQIVGKFEGHGFFTGETTVDLYEKMAAFLSRHLD